MFGGVGMFKDFEYEIKVDPKVKPVVHAPRESPNCFTAQARGSSR